MAVRFSAAVAPGARLAAVDQRGHLGVGARSGPQEDVQVQGQRRHAARAARGTRLRRRAVLGCERPTGYRYGVRSQADARRPPARDQASQCVEVCPRVAGTTGRRDGAGGSCDVARAHGAGRRCDARHGALRVRPSPAADGRLLLALLRRLPRAGQRAALRRAGRRGRRIGKLGARRGPLGAAPTLRAVSAFRDRRGVVLVAGRIDSHLTVARERRTRGAPD